MRSAAGTAGTDVPARSGTRPADLRASARAPMRQAQPRARRPVEAGADGSLYSLAPTQFTARARKK
jgi:hypothetical protein